jgi:hypothetical protein
MHFALDSSQINQNIRRHSETLPFAFRSTDWDDQIFDVHKKTTMIEVPDSVYPPAGSLGNTVGSHAVSAAPLVAKFSA